MTALIAAPWVPPWFAMLIAALWLLLVAVLAVDMWAHRTTRRTPTLRHRSRQQPAPAGPYDWSVSCPWLRQPSHVRRIP